MLAAQMLIQTINLNEISPCHQPQIRYLRDWLVTIATEKVSCDGINPFPAYERANAGNILAQLGDPRPGVGLGPDGLPDIA